MPRSRILLIHNNPLAIKFLCSKLASQDYETTLAADCNAVFDMLENQPPDLILLDTAMSHSISFDICRKIREWSEIPVIILSSKDDELNKVLFFNLGADDYLTQPFSPEILFARIKAVIRRVKNTRIKREKLAQPEALAQETGQRFQPALFN